MRNEKARLIKMIADNSNSRGDKILEFLGRYKLNGMIDAKTQQLREFCKDEKLL